MSFKQGLNILSASSTRYDLVLASIVQIQALCILNDRTMATFVPPLSYDRMIQRWEGFLQETSENKRVIIVFVCPTSSRCSTAGSPGPAFVEMQTPVLNDNLEVGGVISLSLPESETGPFRALVQNLFVHPLHRRKGVATHLLAEVESQALRHQRWSLMLDTTLDTPAVDMYDKLGWTRMGVVKDYGLRLAVKDNELELADEIWFCKDLRSQMSK